MNLQARVLPSLPLLLWKTPPALASILAQEGVAFREVGEEHPLAFKAGRFVLHDGRHISKIRLRSTLGPDHTAIDVHTLRDGEPADPFDQLLDTSGVNKTWRLQHLEVTERVARHDRAKLRRRLLGRLREKIEKAGGVWARLSPYPFPYRSAFNLRVDLDEHAPADYFAFAAARRPIQDATTHFVSTSAYGDSPSVLADLARHDTHSHGHHHVVYREAEANRVNLRRALDRLASSGIDGQGFAAPHGRWNVGLNAELEEIGCEFSSEFQVGYDDLPFFPWIGTRASRILQIPIHPICEGLFFDRGGDDPGPVASHLVAVVLAKLAAGEPAFVYGHPERRLGRFPVIVSALAEAVAAHSLTWRVGLGAFAEWWRWRLGRSWSLVPKGDSDYQLQFEDWDARFALGFEVVRGRHSALIPVTGPVTRFDVRDLAYEHRAPAYSLPPSLPRRRDYGVKSAIRRALDWETITPIDDLPIGSIRSRLKRDLRLWRERSRNAG
jgi:hypothetical protein